MFQQTYRIEPGTEAAKDLFYSGSEREQHCVGHLRGDFGEDGDEFWTSFWPHDGIHLAGDDFNNELSSLIRILRKTLLRNRSHMQCFIQQHPPLTLESGAVMAYGYQVIADRYEYYIRCTPQPGCYNFFIYAYLREE